MNKIKENFLQGFRTDLVAYLQEKTFYDDLLPNAKFVKLPTQNFEINPKIWKEFPIPSYFEFNSIVYVKLNDLRPESVNPKSYCFGFYNIIGLVTEGRFHFDFTKSSSINKTRYPNF